MQCYTDTSEFAATQEQTIMCCLMLQLDSSSVGLCLAMLRNRYVLLSYFAL